MLYTKTSACVSGILDCLIFSFTIRGTFFTGGQRQGPKVKKWVNCIFDKIDPSSIFLLIRKVISGYIFFKVDQEHQVTKKCKKIPQKLFILQNLNFWRIFLSSNILSKVRKLNFSSKNMLEYRMYCTPS